jgi:prephenate dehydratase
MVKDLGDLAPERTIAFQGEPGAYSHLACRNARPDMAPLPCPTFEDAYQAVTEGRAALAMIPIENSLAGRVADNHHLLPESGLHIVGEHFQRVNHQLLGLKGTSLADLKEVHSHVQALGQCRGMLRRLGLKPVAHADTAGAAKMIAERGDPSLGALASSLAAETYGLDILVDGAEDAQHNTTRFVLLSREAETPPAGTPAMMSFVFQVRNVPAALYKSLGGFATNGVNMTKLESYQLEGSFKATMFYADIEGHPDDGSVQLALEELRFFTSTLKILGTYPKSPFRDTLED